MNFSQMTNLALAILAAMHIVSILAAGLVGYVMGLNKRGPRRTTSSANTAQENTGNGATLLSSGSTIIEHSRIPVRP